jgi:two-component system, NtrC family, sensor histidine kinase HydH
VGNGIELLIKTIRVANSGIGFEDRLQGILDLLVRKERIERAILFLTLSETDVLDFKKSSPRDIIRDDKSLHLSRTPIKELIQNRRPLFIPHLNRRDHKTLLKHPLIRGFNSLMAFPVQDDNLLYGVLVLLSRQEMTQDPRTLEILDLVSWELAGILKNSRIYTESKKRIAELSVLFQVGKVIGSTLELNELIERTVAIIAQVINAKGAALSISEKVSGQIIIESEFGLIPSVLKEKIFQNQIKENGDCIFTEEMLGRLPAGGPVPPADKDTPLSGSSISSLICIFLPFKGPYEGRLFVIDKMEVGGERGSPFNEEDLSLLSTMGNIIASSLENAMTFQKIETLAWKNEKMVRNLSTLYQIDTAMMTTAFLKDLSQIILEAITLEEGLGFNRAILFLPDGEKKYLAPTAWSIQEKSGPESPVPAKGLSGNALSHFLIQRASQIRNQRQNTEDSFNALKIHLNKDSGVLARTFLEGRTFFVERALENKGDDQDLARQLHLDAFAAVPMRAKDKVVGVIEVDNYLNKRPITQEDLYLLTMLAHQAGLAFENARLYNDIEKSNQELKVTRERLMESEKMVAIGEMTSGLAHEIRNPLVSIGGFVRRLHKKFSGDEQVQSYFQVIINEVERLEKILNEMTDFSQDPRGRYKEWDLNRIVEAALELIQRELDDAQVKVDKRWEKIPKVFGDHRQLRHVFYNLFLNSCQAMSNGGTLSLRTFLVKESDRSWVVCEVKDTGGGIPPELLHNIFNPFFTTKDYGSGLGLSIVHKIITRHQGEMNIDNHPGEGVSFLVKFPIAKEAQNYFRKFKTMGEEDHETLTNRR